MGSYKVYSLPSEAPFYYTGSTKRPHLRSKRALAWSKWEGLVPRGGFIKQVSFLSVPFSLLCGLGPGQAMGDVIVLGPQTTARAKPGTPGQAVTLRGTLPWGLSPSLMAGV